MKIRNMRYPLVKLPTDVQLSLYLIREEMKSRKFFHTLQHAGLDDCYYQPHLDTLILQSIRFDDGSDETYNVYDAIIEKRSRKIEADNDSIMKQALKVYNELIEEKKKRNNKS